MPSRLSKVFSRTDKTEKQKEAEAEIERNHPDNPSPPPSYAPPGYDEGNILDPPDITAGFGNLSLDQKSQDDFPSSEEVIAHLKLLECFYRLRQQIGSTDGLFGINNSVVTSHAPEGDQAAELLAKVAERRWAVYLARAVDRFDAWLHALLPDAKMARVSQIQSDGEKGLLCEPGPANPPLRFGTHNLPPVDGKIDGCSLPMSDSGLILVSNVGVARLHAEPKGVSGRLSTPRKDVPVAHQYAVEARRRLHQLGDVRLQTGQ